MKNVNTIIVESKKKMDKILWNLKIKKIIIIIFMCSKDITKQKKNEIFKKWNKWWRKVHMWFSLNGNSVPRRRPFSFRLTIHVCKNYEKKNQNSVYFCWFFKEEKVGKFCWFSFVFWFRSIEGFLVVIFQQLWITSQWITHLWITKMHHHQQLWVVKPQFFVSEKLLWFFQWGKFIYYIFLVIWIYYFISGDRCFYFI